MAIPHVVLNQLHATPDERDQIRTIKTLVNGGSIAAGNPGHRIYENTTFPFLPTAPVGSDYHEYRIGAATVPAGGFGPGTGPAGQRRLVLLVRASQCNIVQRAWVRNAAGGAGAAWLEIQTGNNVTLSWLNQELRNGTWGGTIPLAATPAGFAAPTGNQRGYRQILNRAFNSPVTPLVAAPVLPRGNYDLLVLIQPVNQYSVEGKFYTSAHYESWVEII